MPIMAFTWRPKSLYRFFSDPDVTFFDSDDFQGQEKSTNVNELGGKKVLTLQIFYYTHYYRLVKQNTTTDS